MKVLILTGRFGLGHHSVAQAVAEEIRKDNKDAYVEIVDLVEYIFPKSNELIYGSFNFLVSKCSKIYNMLNSVASRHSSIPMKRSVAKKMEGLMEEHRPDIVVSTFPGCSQYISAYKEYKGDNFALYTYITDLTVHEEWLANKTDFYFVGSENTKNVLVSMGINPEIILVTGIPVKNAFKEQKELKVDKNEHKKLEILIMGGGLGLVPKSDELLAKLKERKNVNITLIAGKNAALENKIKKEYPFVDVIGFTDKVDYYMKKADLIVTKSGGITTFEAINTETPLYIVTPFLSQEVGNAQFIEQKGMGRVAWDKKTDIARDVISLMENRKLLAIMKGNMQKTKAEFKSTNPISAFENEKRKVC